MADFTTRFNELLTRTPENDTAVAEALGVSKQTISAWKKGERFPKRPAIRVIADYFNVSVPWLEGITDDETWPDLSDAHRKLHDIAESLPTAKQSRGWQALSRGFSRAEGEPEEYTMSDIDYALSDEIQDLSETDKQEILDYIRFKRAQKAKKEHQP